MNSKIKTFWDNCREGFAHVNRDYEDLITSWKRQFITRIDFNNKTILDYGIGAAYLGKFLFDNYNISHYYGLDISKRSIEHAKDMLKVYDADTYDLKLIESEPPLLEKKVDIIVCQQVIQHFETENMLLQFLDMLKFINADLIMLQTIKPNNGKDLEILKNNPYNDENSVRRACRVSSDYIVSKLNTYRLHSNFSEKAYLGDLSCFNIYTKK